MLSDIRILAAGSKEVIVSKLQFNSSCNLVISSQKTCHIQPTRHIGIHQFELFASLMAFACEAKTIIPCPSPGHALSEPSTVISIL